MQRTLDVVSATKNFSTLMLPPLIEQALRDAGFRRPSPVQEAALPLARMGTDLIAQAKAGTGKTLVFAVAAVERVDLANAAPQVLVLAPTREIALQASEAVALVAATLPPPGLTCGTFIGGLPVEEDEKQLRRACHVAVGTTGRILSLIHRGALRTDSLRMVVLDEADKLLGDSFRKDVLAIVAATPARRQILALSATYAPVALEHLRRLMRGHQQEVLLCADDTSLLGVRQFYKLISGSTSSTNGGIGSSGGGSVPLQQPQQQQQLVAEAVSGTGSTAVSGGPGAGSSLDARVAALLNLLSSVSFQQAVVFCKYTADAEEVADRLLAAGYPAAYLSGQRSQLQRIEALNALRDFRLRVAVSTDLAARGVDLDLVNLVVNLELPGDSATYMHRVGRAGRFGTRGMAVTLLEGPGQLGRMEGYLLEVSGGQACELPDHIPEDWYTHGTAQYPIQAASSAAVVAAGAAGSIGMGPDTPAASSGPLAASLAAGSLESGGGALADIATASLWEGEEEADEGDFGGQCEVQAGAEADTTAEQHAQQHEASLERQGSGSSIDVGYTVVPKPAGLVSPAVQASADSAAGVHCGAPPAAAIPAPSVPLPAAGKPAVSSLTAAVAAAEASSRGCTGATAVATSAPDDSSADSVDSWDSTSDDDYSGSSSDRGTAPLATAAATAAAQCNGRPLGGTCDGSARPGRPVPHSTPLRRISSASSGSSSSSSSGRISSPPAPIPGRGQLSQGDQVRALWHNSFEEGCGGLAQAAAVPEHVADGSSKGGSDAGGGGAPACGHHCRANSGSGEEEEPSFKDSWLAEEERQAAAEDKQRELQRRHAIMAAAEAADCIDFELRPHRSGPSGAAAARASAGGKPAVAAVERARQQAQGPQAQQVQQAQHAAQGHYWEVVRGVERDVQGRLSAPCAPTGSGTAAAAGAAAAGWQADREGSEEDSDCEEEGEFVPTVPRQRRPLGSAQLTATRRRVDEATAFRAAEAAALEMMADQDEEEEDEEEDVLQQQQQFAHSTGGAAPAVAGAAPCGSEEEASAADAAAAEQQRQWSEFWMQHYAYYGCYPSEGMFSPVDQTAQPATDAATAPTAGAQQDSTAAPGPAAEAVVAATLPPPPPSPPAPPTLLSAAAWVCQPPAGAEHAASSAAASAAAGAAAAHASSEGGEAPEGGWVAVPSALLARYQQLEWQQWHRQHTEWQQMWEQYKQYWHALYDQQQQEQQQLEQQQQQQQQPQG